jgi:tetratricopeptide (TPR) repeat protein
VPSDLQTFIFLGRSDANCVSVQLTLRFSLSECCCLAIELLLALAYDRVIDTPRPIAIIELIHCGCEQEAIERALEDDPASKAAMQEVQLRRIRASAAKELGNAAFKARDFVEAIKQYSAAIEADNTDAAFYSNRWVSTLPMSYFAVHSPQLFGW